MRCPKCGYDLTRTNEQRKKFHAVVRDYMRVTGYGFEYAKTELKYQFGRWAEIYYNEESGQVEYLHNNGLITVDPPEWPGKIVHAYGKEIYLKSEAAYTKEEENFVIDFSERAVMEASI